MKIAIGNNHLGTEYKLAIIGLLKSMHISVINYGTDGTDEVDYTDFADLVASDLQQGTVSFSILIGGTGNGVCMTADKHQGIRAANCYTEELTVLARQENDANILCLPARYISLHQALRMVTAFINTSFNGGKNERRLEKMPLK